MILTELKDYIEQNSNVNRKTIAKEFGIAEDGVDAMLDVWIKKGVIARTIDTNRDYAVKRVRYRIIPSDQLSITVTL